MKYEEKFAKAESDFIESGGEGTFRPPERAQSDMPDREIPITEYIAIAMIEHAFETGNVYSFNSDYYKQVIRNHDYLLDAPEDSWPMIDNLLNGRRPDGSESLDDYSYFNKGRQTTIAVHYLAQAIISSRKTGNTSLYTDLGYGIGIHSSLAAEILNFHKRICWIS